MEIDETLLTPLFVQVAQWLEDEILRDNIREEEQIPSTNQFAAMYNINPATARKGFALLTEEGIIYKKRGIGMFVCSGAKEKIQTLAKERFLKDTVEDIIMQAKRLGITSEQLIQIIKDKMV